MADSPATASRQPSTQSSESPGGFRSFWKSHQKTQSQQVTFVQQDPSKKSRNRLSRIFKPTSSSNSGESSTTDAGEDKSANAQKRRQQVYEAQRRHRNRKANYVEELEAEMTRLQRLDAKVNREKNNLMRQNTAMKEMLKSQPVDVQLDAVALDTTAPTDHDDLSWLIGSTVEVRHDADVGHERTFVDFPNASGSSTEMFWDLSEPSADGTQARQPLQQHEPVSEDSWAALDFILALEWPCKDHITDHINWDLDQGDWEEPLRCRSFLTCTAQVYESMQPARSLEMNSPAQSTYKPRDTAMAVGVPSEGWLLPHSEIDKLVRLSEALEIDEEEITPAQAYSIIRQMVSTTEKLRPTLERLKKPLGGIVTCLGFGAIMDTQLFRYHLDEAIHGLGIGT